MSQLLKKYSKPLAIAGGATALLGLGYLLYRGTCKKCNKSAVKKSEKTESPEEIPANHHLSQDQAVARRGQIVENVKYSILLKIQKGTHYSGAVTVDFKCHNAGANVFFDFEGESIEELVLNGQTIKKVDNWKQLYDGCFFTLPREQVQAGRNKLTIHFRNKYSTDGNGFHTFTDTDGKQYVYSHAEPFHAHKFIPCFDQPDIKAVYDLTVISPDDWIVIANEICAMRNPFKDSSEYLLNDDTFKGFQNKKSF